MAYKLQINIIGEQSIIRLEDMAHIPFDDGNIDYQAYLKFLAEGGQTLPADSE
jgi:hypothetical protein